MSCFGGLVSFMANTVKALHLLGWTGFNPLLQGRQ